MHDLENYQTLFLINPATATITAAAAITTAAAAITA